MFDDSRKSYEKTLGKIFKDNKTVLFGDLIRGGKRGETIKKGTLVITSLINNKIVITISEKDIEYRGTTFPIMVDKEWVEKGVTTNYLLWFFSQDFVIDYLKSCLRGTIIARVPLKELYELKFPLPAFNVEGEVEVVESPLKELELFKQASPVRSVLNHFLVDYQFSREQANYRTAAILAAAFCEALLYQLLLDNGVEMKFLEADNSLDMDKIINYVQLQKLDDELDFSINHFIEVQSNRNRALHSNPSLKESEQLREDDFHGMNEIIKRFGF